MEYVYYHCISHPIKNTQSFFDLYTNDKKIVEETIKHNYYVFVMTCDCFVKDVENLCKGDKDLAFENFTHLSPKFIQIYNNTYAHKHGKFSFKILKPTKESKKEIVIINNDDLIINKEEFLNLIDVNTIICIETKMFNLVDEHTGLIYPMIKHSKKEEEILKFINQLLLNTSFFLRIESKGINALSIEHAYIIDKYPTTKACNINK